MADDGVFTEEMIRSAVQRTEDLEADRDRLANELYVAQCEAEDLRKARDELKQRILDIDAHATPYGDIPGEPGYVGTYLLTGGALHRALGKIGHTAPKCQAEAVIARVRSLLDEWQRQPELLPSAGRAVVDALEEALIDPYDQAVPHG